MAFEKFILLKSLVFLAEHLGIDLQQTKGENSLDSPLSSVKAAEDVALLQETPPANWQGHEWLAFYRSFRCDKRDDRGQMTPAYVLKMFVLLTTPEVLGLDRIMRYTDSNINRIQEKGPLSGSISYPPVLDGVLASLPATAPHLKRLVIEGNVTGIPAWLPLGLLSSLQQVKPGSLAPTAVTHGLAGDDIKKILALLLPQGAKIS